MFDKIKRKKEKGMAGMASCLFLLIIVIILISFTFHYRMISLTKAELEDGLTISALSALIFDAGLYAKDGSMCIDPDRAYAAFTSLLKANLGLDEDYNAVNQVYYRALNIEKFVIYNVSEDVVTRIEYGQGGAYVSKKYELEQGSVQAENGQIIERSSLYVSLGIELRGFAGQPGSYVTVDNLLALDGN